MPNLLEVLCILFWSYEKNGTTDSSTQRGYLTSELNKCPDTLKLDTNYYLTNQIHPVITRLCEPIEGIDAFHVAQSLGLDPAGFKHKSSGSKTLSIAAPQLTKQQKKMENYMNDVEKYVDYYYDIYWGFISYILRVYRLFIRLLPLTF